jgi:acyl-[acyl-carrier-protein]-phospholipid O-acyltransferase/long-chain-fatty-acid--[acyl-carrier-protein] ligase
MLVIFTKRLLPLFITQFLGAFNDNIYKNALVILITYKIAEQTGENAQVLITVAAALFILPFFIFSAPAGQLADKYDRAAVARWTKIAEIIITIFAALALYLGNTWFLIAVLFVLGTQSTFFGPVKYAILPQLLPKDELLSGNAYVEAGTFLAILLGTIVGGLMILTHDGTTVVSAILMLVALCGYWASIHIPSAPAPMPDLSLNPNILHETIRIMGYSYKNKRIFYYILCISNIS